MNDPRRSAEGGTDQDKFIFVNLRTEEPPEPPEEETRFFREKYKPPFVKFVGSGKRVASSLTALQAIALAYAFPAFHGRATVDKAGATEPEWAQKVRDSPSYDDNVERQLQMRGAFRRRYSGDSHQPLLREKYFALYGEGAKEQSHTLLGELNAYSLPLKSGYCAAVPLAELNTIGVVFRGLPGEPNPLYHFVSEPSLYGHLFNDLPRDPRSIISPDLVASVSSATEFQVALPYEDVPLSIEQAFDLRLPEARQWMVNFFRHPPPVETNDDLAHGGWLQLMADSYNFDLSKVEDWRTLLPVINDASFGGNGMTDIFAAFVRRLGCGGIVYPSARCDYGVVFDEGQIVDHWGWNLVNYTGSPIPTRLAPEEATPLQHREGIYHFAEIKNGAHAGSIVSLGNSLYTKFMNQTLFDQYAFLHGSEWRLKHKLNTMSVRGYCWYRCNYSLKHESNEVINCDACDNQFPIGQVALLPRCPVCQFAGDLGVFVSVPEFVIPHLKQVNSQIV